MVAARVGVTLRIERNIQNLPEKKTGGGRNKRERIQLQILAEDDGTL